MRYALLAAAMLFAALYPVATGLAKPGTSPVRPAVSSGASEVASELWSIYVAFTRVGSGPVD